MQTTGDTQMKTFKFLGTKSKYFSDGYFHYFEFVAGSLSFSASNVISENKWIFFFGKKRFKILLPTLRDIRYNVRQFFKKLSPMPVYYHYTSRDCDEFEVNDVIKFKNYRAYLAHREEEYKWLEGPIYYSPCSKKYYESYERNTRDHRAEYYNY